MPIEGYWISPSGDFGEVHDHFTVVQENPETFGVSPEIAVGWKRQDREEMLRKLIQDGWIRVRGHKHYTTFEIAEFNQHVGWSIKNFLEQTKAWPNEKVEIHELAKKRQWAVDAGYFLEERHLELTGPGQNVTVNHVSPGLAEALMNEGFLRDQGFHPRGLPKLYGTGNSGLGAVQSRRDLPGEPTLIGALVMGLGSGYGPQEAFTVDAVRDAAMRKFPEGGTLAVQHGWFRAVKEDSVRITIENVDMGLAQEKFQEMFNAMAGEFVEIFRQQTIWVDFYRGSERIEALRFDWDGKTA